MPRLWHGLGAQAQDPLALQGRDRGHNRVRDLPLLPGCDVAEPPPLTLARARAGLGPREPQRGRRSGRERSRRALAPSPRVATSTRVNHPGFSSTRSCSLGGSTRAHSTANTWSGADFTGIGAPPGRLLRPSLPGGRLIGPTNSILSRSAGRIQGSALVCGDVHRGKTAVHRAPSSSSRACLRSGPAAKPPRRPSAESTRWQGTRMRRGFRATA